MNVPQIDQDSTARRCPRWFWLVLIAITMLGGAMRWYRIAQPSMWVDELFTVRHSIEAANGKLEKRPLAYTPSALCYWLGGVDIANLDQDDYSGWRAAGINETFIRVPAWITGVVGILVLGWLSRRMLGWQAALILALLLAFSSWHLWSSQTARFYGQQMLLYNIGFILYYDATRRNSRPLMAMTGLFILLAFASQLTSLVLVLVFLADWVIARARRQPVRWGWCGWLCIAGTAAICLGWYKWYTPDVNHAVGNFVGSTHGVKDILLGTPFMVGFPVATAAVLAAWWMLREQARLAILLAVGAVLPIVVIAGLKYFGDVDVHVRYCFITLYSWLALVAVALWRLFEHVRGSGRLLAWIPLAVVLVSMAFGDYIYFQGAAGYRPRWRDAFAYVQDHRQQGQEVVGGDSIPRLVGDYYLKMDDEAIVAVTSQMRGDDYARVTDGKPIWIVVRGVSATRGERFRWIHEHAELKAYFATQTFQPYSSVHVYLYDPATIAN